MRLTRVLGAVLGTTIAFGVPVVQAAAASAATDPFGPPGTIPRAPAAGVPLGQTFGEQAYAENPTVVTDDVNTATGAFTLATTDVTVAGVGLPFVLTRAYSSRDTAVGAFGQGWSSLLDAGLSGLATAKATFRAEDGQRITFTRSGSSWKPDLGVRASLACGGPSCTLRRFDGTRWELRNGLPVELDAPDGHGLRFGYAPDGRLNRVVVETRSGPALNVDVVWTAGRVTAVRTPTRQVSYGYTAGLLTSVTDVRGKVWTMAYDAASRLTTVTDPLAHVRDAVTYDGAGKVARSRALGGVRRHDTEFTYTATATTYRPLSSVHGVATRNDWTDTYAVGNVLQRRTSPTGANTAYAYDASLGLVAIRDLRGGVQQFAYNAAGDVTAVKSPVDATTAGVVAMTYDSSHRLTSLTDALGRTTYYAYDGGGHVTRVSAPGGAEHRYFYEDGLLTSEVSPQGVRTDYDFDRAGNATRVVVREDEDRRPTGRGPVSTYDEAGNRTSVTDPRGNLPFGLDPAYRTTFVVDAAGNALETRDALGRSTFTAYDAAGDVVSTTDRAGVVTTRAWNEATATRTMTTAGVATVERYDAAGHLLGESHNGYETTTSTYENDGSLGRTVDAANVVTTYTRDAGGNVVHSERNGVATDLTYDLQNRAVRIVSDGQVALTSYDKAGNVTSRTDAASGRVTYTWTVRDKVASVLDATGLTSYYYDRDDNLTARTDQAGHTTYYGYDGAGRRTASSTGGATTLFNHDVAGNLVGTVDPDGRVGTFTVDRAGRRTAARYRWPTSRGSVGTDTTYAFDALDRRTSMTDNNGTTAYVYDAAGHLTNVTRGADTFTYDYSVAGKETETYPDGTSVTYSLDDAQHLMDVSATSPVSASVDVRVAYVRDALRRPTHLAALNGVIEDRVWNSRDNVLSQTLSRTGSTLTSTAFTYDAAGNRLTATNVTGAVTSVAKYGYGGAASGSSQSPGGGGADPVAGAVDNRLTSFTLDGVPTSYAYDAAGNRRTTTTTAGTTSYAYDYRDRVTAWTHDNAGNVTKMGRRAITYDAASRIVKIVDTTDTANTVTTSFTYDGDGNRLTKSVASTSGTVVTQYAWDQQGAFPVLALERRPGGALVRRYVNGDGPVAMQTPGHTYYFHLDPLGSVTALSDENGDVVARTTYDAWGNVAASTATAAAPVSPLGFTGQYRDAETGLYDLRARTYDPVSGRFLSRDPLGPLPGAPAQSPYVYAADRPTVLTDPTGTTPTSESVFMGKPTLAGNVANDSKGAVALSTAALKGGAAAFAYAAKPAGMAAKAFQEEGKFASTFKHVKTAGRVLTVAGLLLGAVLMEEDCRTGTLQQCIADGVGMAFSVGCLAITSGVGSAACAIAGAVISYVIGEYGDEIVDGVLYASTAVAAFASDVYDQAAELTRSGFAAGLAATEAGLTVATDGLVSAYGTVSATLESGFNDASAAVASGFNGAVDTLRDAGYSAAALAETLKESFVSGLHDTIAVLEDFGYTVAGIATALKDVFDQTAAQAAAVLQDFGHSVAEIATQLADVFSSTAAEAAAVLKDLGYTVAQIATQLADVFSSTAAEAAAVLKDLGYSVAQIATQLADVFSSTAAEAAAVLKDLGYSVAQIATQLADVFASTAAEAAAVLKDLGYSVAQIATQLADVFSSTAAEAAAVLKDLGYSVAQIATQLADVFSATAAQAASILKGLAYGAAEIATQLKDVFLSTAAAAASILNDLAFGAASIATQLKDVYGQAANAVAGILKDLAFGVDVIGTQLKNVFGQAADAAAATLAFVSFGATAIAGALGDVYARTAAQAASILNGLGYGATALANALKDAFGQTVTQAAQILKDLGDDAALVGAALKDAFSSLGSAVVAGALKTVGYALNAITDVLQDVYGLGATAAAGVLQGLGYAGDAVAGALKSVGYAIGDIASALGSAFGAAGDAIGGWLQSAGFSLDSISAVGGAVGDWAGDALDAIAHCFEDPLDCL
jgi:RHS repeat-associated protein